MFGSGVADDLEDEIDEDDEEFMFDAEDEDADEDEEIFEEGLSDYGEEPFTYDSEFPSHMSVPFFTILNEILLFLIYLFFQKKKRWSFFSFIFSKFWL